jgi:peptidoglycan/LPS O-acetylase OafA/YrhL
MAIKRLAEMLNRDQNSLDLLRTLAAMAVIFGHSFSLHPSGGWTEPVASAFDFTYSGALAVDIFFFLSGILVSSSYCQSRSIHRFILMRISRIWPGLIVCIAISVFVVGPLVTSKPIASYLLAWDTRWYVLNNIQLQKISYFLPGVFTENYYKDAVNGSLWTLPIEIRCYLMVLILGMLGGFTNRASLIVLAIAFAILVVTNHIGPLELFLVSSADTAILPLLFALGMLCYATRNYIRIDWRLSILAIIVAVAFKTTLIGIAALYLFVLNTTLVIGSLRPTRLKLPGDYSYGIYIYGFVVQQCVAHYAPRITSYPSLLLSLPLSLGLAILSWHFIEYPAMNIGRDIATWYELKSKASGYSGTAEQK